MTTEEAVIALRKAAKWAQMGLVVSTGPPVDATAQTQGTDKKKTATEVSQLFYYVASQYQHLFM